MQDSKLWGPHPLVNFLDLWKSTLTLKHLLDAFGQSSGAHRSCVLGSQVQHGMLSGCNVKRGQIQVEEKKIYIYIYIYFKKTFFTQFFAHQYAFPAVASFHLIKAELLLPSVQGSDVWN